MALPTPLYRSGELCGACVRLWCVDSVCTDALVRNASFMVRLQVSIQLTPLRTLPCLQASVHAWFRVHLCRAFHAQRGAGLAQASQGGARSVFRPPPAAASAPTTATSCRCPPQVTDSCKECTGNSILVSERGFANLTGVNVNISPMLQVGRLVGWLVGGAAQDRRSAAVSCSGQLQQCLL